MKTHLILVLIGSIFMSGIVYAGGHVGGVDNRPLDSAWFVYDAVQTPEPTIPVCFERAPDFGPSSADVTEAIRNAFATWHAYRAGLHDGPIQPAFDIRPVDLVDIHPSCNGSEGVVFYFGVNTPDTEAAQKDYFVPLAFVHRTDYDIHTGSGKGFVWVSGHPSFHWTKNNSLKGILLHEVGHILGSPHIEGTIMDEDIAPDFFRSWDGNPFDAQEFLQIDQKKFFISPTYYTRRVSAVIASGGGYPPRTAAETFKLFTGRDPVGEISATFDNTGNKDRLVLFDSQGPVDVHVQSNWDAAIFGGNGMAFVSTLITSGPTFYGGGLKAAVGASWTARITDAKGVDHDATVLVNSNDSPLKIDYKDGTVTYHLIRVSVPNGF